MTSNAVLIAVTEAALAVEDLGDAPIEDRVRAAMRKTWRHWVATNEDDQFAAAVEAVARLANDEERDALIAEYRVLGMFGGGVVNLDEVAAFAAQVPNPVGLLKLWNEVKSDQRSADPARRLGPQ